jgi:hypothetical protein
VFIAVVAFITSDFIGFIVGFFFVAFITRVFTCFMIESFIVAFIAGAFMGFLVEFFFLACIALLAFIAFMAFSEALTFLIALPDAMLMMGIVNVIWSTEYVVLAIENTYLCCVRPPFFGRRDTSIRKCSKQHPIK